MVCSLASDLRGPRSVSTVKPDVLKEFSRETLPFVPDARQKNAGYIFYNILVYTVLLFLYIRIYFRHM